MRLLEALRRARADQRATDYPGCARGVMMCRSTVCGCLNESRPSLSFLLARVRHHLEPEEPVVPLKLWAFWRHDLFPYVLCGEAEEQREDGCVTVKGYGRGMWFKPFYMASGRAGEQLAHEVRRVKAAWRIHEECARNGAGKVAAEALAAAGLPVAGLPLERTGWQGEAYQDLFRRQLREER